MKHFYIRVEDDSLPRKLKTIAAQKDMTLSAVIEKALTQYVNRIIKKEVD